MASMENMSSGNVDRDTACVSNCDHYYNYMAYIQIIVQLVAFQCTCATQIMELYAYGYQISTAMDIKKVYKNGIIATIYSYYIY